MAFTTTRPKLGLLSPTNRDQRNLRDISVSLEQATSTSANLASSKDGDLFVNGRMSVWQRGLHRTLAGGSNYSWNPAPTGVYADRWALSVVNASAAVDRVFVGTTADIQSRPQYCFQMSWSSSSTSGNKVLLQQKIEDLTLTAGQTITVTFWARTTSGTLPIAVEARQVSEGGLDVPGIEPYVFTLTTDWTQYTYKAAIPDSLVDLQDYRSWLGIRFWFSAGTTYSTESKNLGVQNGVIQFTAAKCEIGNGSTPITGISPYKEHSICERYWQYGQYAGIVARSLGATTLYLPFIPFRTEMVKVPSCSVDMYYAALGSTPTTHWTGTYDITPYKHGFRVQAVNGPTLAQGPYDIQLYFAADAEL